MGKFRDQINELNKEFLKVYIPSTAFTNPEIGKIQHKINALNEQMDGKEECPECDGWGGKECCECGQDRDCWACDNTGLVEKKQEELIKSI